MCGGPGPRLTSAEGNVSDLANQELQLMNTAFNTALPQEQKTLQAGTGILPEELDYAGGTTAQSFAPAQGQLNRQLAQAGISPNDPTAISLQSQLNEQKGKAFDASKVQQLLQEWQAKQSAAGNLLQFGASQNPLSAYATLLQTILNS